MSLEDAFGVDPQTVLSDVVRQKAPDLTDNGVVDPSVMMDRLVRKHIYGQNGQKPATSQQQGQQKPDFYQSTRSPLGDDEFYSGTREPDAEQPKPGVVDEAAQRQERAQQRDKERKALDEPPPPMSADKIAAINATPPAPAQPVQPGVGYGVPGVDMEQPPPPPAPAAGAPPQPPVTARALSPEEVKASRERVAKQPMGAFELAGKTVERAAQGQFGNIADAFGEWKKQKEYKQPDYIDTKLNQSMIKDGGWKDPDWWTVHLFNMAGEMTPALTLTAMGVPGPAAFALTSGLQSLVPAYQHALDSGLSEDQAVKQAWEIAGIDAAVGGVLGFIPGGVEEGATIKEAILKGLRNMGLVAPGTMVAGEKAKAMVRGEPYGPGEAAETAAFGAATGLAMSAPHLAAAARPRATEGAPARPESGAGTGEAPAAGLPPPGAGEAGAGAAPGAGPRPSAGPGGAGAAAEPPKEKPQPFKTGLNPKTRSKLEAAANYYKEFEPSDVASWSDARLKEYVTRKNAEASMGSDDDVLRRAGYGDDDIAGMDATVKKATAEEMRKYGVHAGAEPAAEGTREAPVEAETGDDVATAAAAASQDHTSAQGAANNAQRGHMRWQDLDITLEAPAGGVRRGQTDGQDWEQKFSSNYGYIRGVPPAADGQAPDVFVGQRPEADRVFVVDEVDPKTGQYRQSKSFVGFDSVRDVIAAYLGTSGKTRDQIGGISSLGVDEFKEIAKNGGLAHPLSDRVKNGRLRREAAQSEPPASGRVPGMEGNEEPMQQPERAGLQKLRRPGREGVPGVGDQFSAVPGGHGAEAVVEAQPRAAGQRQGLPSSQRGLGGAGGAEPKQAQSSARQGGREPGVAAGDGGKSHRPVEERAEAAPQADAHGPAALSARDAERRGDVHSRGGAQVGASAGRVEEPPAARDERTRGAHAESIQAAGAAASGRERQVPVRPEHIAAVDAAIRATGEDPAQLEPADLVERAAEIHAGGVPPEQAVQAAIVKAAVENGVLTEEQARQIYGDKVSAVMDSGAASKRRLQSAQGSAPARGEAAAGGEVGAVLPHGGKARQGTEVTEGGAGGKAGGRVGEAGAAGRPEEGRGTADTAAGGKRTAAVGGDRAAGTHGETGQHARAAEAAGHAEGALIGARADAKVITPAMLDRLGEPDNLGAVGNRPFVRSFVSALPASERGALTTADGDLSAEGLARVRNAVLAKAYDDTDIIARITESTDDEVKSISSALVTAAPMWAKFRAEVEAGRVRKEFDLTPDLMEAVKRTADLRARGTKLADYLAQRDAFDQLGGNVESFMRWFYDPQGRRAAGGGRIAEKLKFYAGEAGKVTTDPRLDFALPEVTPDDIQRAAYEKAEGAASGGAPRAGTGVDAGWKEARGSEPGEGGEAGGGRGERSSRRGFAQPDNDIFGLGPSERADLYRTYRELAAEQSGFRTVYIGDLIDRSGLPKDQVHAALLDAARRGEVSLHGTTVAWATLSKARQEGSIALPDAPEPYVKVVFKTERPFEKEATAATETRAKPASTKDIIAQGVKAGKSDAEIAQSLDGKLSPDDVRVVRTSRSFQDYLKGFAEGGPDLFGPSERTAAGDQLVLPGAERISQGELAKRRAAEPLKAKREQKPPDQGLFAPRERQTDLEQAIAEKEGKARETGPSDSKRKAVGFKEDEPRHDHRTRGIPASGRDPVAAFDRAGLATLQGHPDYRAAKAGDHVAAGRLVRDLMPQARIDDAKARFGADAVYLPVIAEEQSGHNMIPTALADHVARGTGAAVTADIVQASRAYHTGAGPMERLTTRVRFAGPVKPGKRYVLVDDVSVMGSTLADLAHYIQANGGEVAGAVVLVNAGRSGVLTAPKPAIRDIERRYGDAIRELFHTEPGALTADEAQYIRNFRDADALRAAAAKAERERGARLLSKGIRPEGLNERTGTESGAPRGAVFNWRSSGYGYEGQARRVNDGTVDLGPFRPEAGVPLGRQAQDYVVDRGRLTGDEHLVAIDQNGAIIDHARGRSDFVGLSPKLDAALSNPKRAVAIHHNHPSDGPFSDADLSMLAMPGLASVWAHGHEGRVYRAAITPQARSFLANEGIPPTRNRADLIRLYNRVQSQFVPPLRAAVEQRELEVRRANELAAHLVALSFQRAGLIDYQTNADFTPEIKKYALDNYIDFVARAIAERLKLNASRPNPDDRQPGPVRHLGEMGATFGPPASVAAQGRGGGGNDRARRANDRKEPPGQLRLPGFAGALSDIFPAPPFYSAVGRAVETVKQAKAAPNHWLGVIKNTPGVKPEEIEWLGLEDWLKEQKGPVTKEALQDYIRANEIQVREVEKGAAIAARAGDVRVAPHPDFPGEWTLQHANGDYASPPGEGVPRWRSRADAEAALANAETRQYYLGGESFGGEGGGDTKFGQYTLPGGENYRELLLTLPRKELATAGDVEEAAKALAEKYGRSWNDMGSYEKEGWRRDAREAGKGNYRSSHFDEPNILAHVRFNDRVIDGKRTLFLEEVQSDWMQALRRQGIARDKAIDTNFLGITLEMEKAGRIRIECD